MHCDQRFVNQMLAAGASGFLSKNSTFEELVVAIKAVSDKTIYLSPLVTEVDAGNAHPSKMHDLSHREREVLQLVVEGKTTKEIAFNFNLSIKTVQAHRQQGMARLNIDSIASLTKYAIRSGLTDLGNKQCIELLSVSSLTYCDEQWLPNFKK